MYSSWYDLYSLEFFLTGTEIKKKTIPPTKADRKKKEGRGRRRKGVEGGSRSK